MRQKHHTSVQKEVTCMEEEQKKTGKGVWKWFLPLILALPLLGAAAFALNRWGDTLQDIVNILIKAVVVS